MTTHQHNEGNSSRSNQMPNLSSHREKLNNSRNDVVGAEPSITPLSAVQGGSQGVEVDAEIAKLTAGLKGLPRNEQQVKAAKFRALFPVIKEVLNDNVPQRTVIAYLAEQGLKLSPNTFRSMLDAEEKRRSEGGGVQTT
jgi:hypothetical protein